MRIVLANEPRAYRDSIAAAISNLRSDAEVITVEPNELDGEIVQSEPDLVVCSRLTEAVETRPLAWILLYPDGASVAVISLAGKRQTIPDAEFPTLLSAIDQVGDLAETG